MFAYLCGNMMVHELFEYCICCLGIIQFVHVLMGKTHRSLPKKLINVQLY